MYKLSCASCNFIAIHLLPFVGVYVAVSGVRGLLILLTSCMLISSWDLLRHVPPTSKTKVVGDRGWCSISVASSQTFDDADLDYQLLLWQ